MRVRLVAAVLLCLVGPAGAAGPGAVLEAAKVGMAAAEEALAAARAAPDRPAALALAVRIHEEAVADLRAAVIAIGARDREVALALAARREETATLLAALQSLPADVAEGPGLHPKGPIAAARAAALVARLRPAFQERATDLANDLAIRAEARSLQAEGYEALARGLERLQSARAELREALLAAGVAPAAPDVAMAAVVHGSDSLAALADAFDASGGGDGTGAGLHWPVRGEILRGFRVADGAGVRQPVVVLGAPPLAVVEAPDDASVRYAGPFLDYGQVAVLGLHDGATMILAGLAQVTARTGDSVTRGEPLGLLGGRTLEADEYVMLTDADTGAGARQALYILISSERGPVDPVPWFGVDNG